MSTLIQRRRFTTEDYHRMGDAGILRSGDRVELIDGEIVAMSPIGNPHNAAVDRATRAMVRAAGDTAIVRVQGSVLLDRFNEPQPDIVLLKPRDDFYRERAAGPADIILIVEVADSSLAYDHRLKTRLYADAGIAEYWLGDISGERVFVSAVPRPGAYETVRQLRRGDTVSPSALPSCAISVDDLLP
ncbi:MAG TPA: Uma2 family endonuclease [Terriglobia bacterium]|nr:Uma2 family endonuclease [Terriglobia bacterium]